METRARRQGKRSLPRELWCIILGHLTPQEAAQAACVSHEFASISGPAAERACERLFPKHSHRVVRLLRQWKLGVHKVINLINQHENELVAHPDVQKANQVQKLVLPEHRQIAVEWLIEVAWDWQLESTVVYRGAQYLDHFLATVPVQALSKFQMLAISALRTALKHSSKLAERERAKLPYKNWAEVTDGACTETEVRSTCTKLERILQQKHRDHPNAKQRLRYLWYRLYEAGVVRQEHVYVYMLASFLLHLSILDSSLSAVTPTLLATAALSLSLDVFRFSPWPTVLQEHSLYLQEDLQEPQDMLRKTQEELPAEQLRSLWVHSYSYIGTNPLQQPAYSHLQLIVMQRGAIRQLDVNLHSARNSPSSSGSTTIATAIPGLRAAAGTAVLAAAGVGLPAALAGTNAAVAGPADGSVVIGVVPAAAAPRNTPAQMPAPVGRVTTRAAAAAGHYQHQRQQQASGRSQAVDAAAAIPGNRHTASAPACSSQQQQQMLLSDRSLPTPQRTSLAPVPFGAVEHAVRSGPAAVGAASLMAGLAGGPSTSGHIEAANTPAAAAGAGAASSTGSAGRQPTRELPARRAVVSSRYGCRAAGAHGAAAGASSSSAAAAAPLSRVPPAAAAAHNSFSAGLVSAVGSVTPASPKHTVAGHRGLAALFAGAAPAPAPATGVRTRSADVMLQTYRMGSVELDRLAEGTPQPLQLMSLQAQLHGKMADPAQPKSSIVGKGMAAAAGGNGHAGSAGGSSLLAACQAAAAAGPGL